MNEPTGKPDGVERENWILVFRERVPSYCAVPYNNIKCDFFEKPSTGSLWWKKQKGWCGLFNVELKEARKGSGIYFPCEGCEENRHLEIDEGKDDGGE